MPYIKDAEGYPKFNSLLLWGAGFPREGSVTVTPRTPGSRGLTRIERKYLYEKNDPVGGP